MTRRILSLVLSTAIAITTAAASTADERADKADKKEPRQPIAIDDIADGDFSLRELRRAGLEVFAVPFDHADGHGDGPVNPDDTTGFGGRPTLQNNGTYLRVNGLDSQSCVECHGLMSTSEIPVRLGIGGFGGIANVPIFMPKEIDVDDEQGNGFAFLDGRLIVPPHLFGTGGVQLLGKEMTAELQELRREAIANPGVIVELWTKGVDFGSIVANDFGEVDTSRIEGIDEDLVVRPFGRKGEFASVRQFDLGALQFHLGIQPTEIVGEGVDGDGDGVIDEIGPGLVTALEIFLTTMEKPRREQLGRDGRRGRSHFRDAGCRECHRPLETERTILPYAFPEIDTEPFENTIFEVDLKRGPARFRRAKGGGLRIPLFSDMKRHDMGPDLAETFHAASDQQNSEFITAKLWGVGDSAPYLHDGRALTLSEAIELHGGEAASARDAFLALGDIERDQLITFLRSLRLPKNPNADVLNRR